MKRLIILILAFTMLCGCSNEATHKKIEYEGKFLNIGVVGNSQLPKFTNVSYEHTTLDSLLKNRTQYDALIVTKDAFSEADKDKYVPLFNEIKYPVFFFGIEDFRIFAFTKEGVTIDMAKDKNSAFVQGFKNPDSQERQQWELYLPENPTNRDKMKYMLLKIFKILNEEGKQ